MKVVIIGLCLVVAYVGAEEINQIAEPANQTSEQLVSLQLCDETSFFSCGNGSVVLIEMCISKAAYCNGVWDCDNGADELTCFFDVCPYKSQVPCKDKTACVAPKKICDTKFDCWDHSDERGCSK